MPYCPNCGEQVDDRSRYCGNCGTDVSDVPRESGSDTGWGRNQSEWGENTQSGHTGTQQTDKHGSPAGHHQQQGRQQGTPGQGHTQGPSNALDFSFSFPKQNGWKPVIISSVLALLSFLIVPALILVGYGFRVARWAATDQAQPPEYSDWGELAIDGLRFSLLYTVGFFIFFILYFVAIGGLSAVTAASDPTGALFVLVIPLYFLGYIAIFALSNALPTVFVGNDSVIGSFTDGRLKALLTSWYFYKALLFFFALQIIFQTLLMFSIFTIIGPIVVSAYTVLAFGAYWGYVYKEAANRGIVPPAEGIGPSQQHQQPQY